MKLDITGLATMACSLFACAALGANPFFSPTIADRHIAMIASDGDCTAQLQAAFDQSRDAGGGHIDLASGSYVSGPLVMYSNTDLHLAARAVLRFSNDIAHYPLRNNRYIDCLTATNAHDISITGTGTIDGQGQPWWAIYRKLAPGESISTKRPDPATLSHRPYMVVMRHCQRVVVQGVTLTNSPSFHLVPDGCQDVTIDGIKIIAPADAPNTDGIDPSGLNFHITGCAFDVGDDCIAIKPSTLSIAAHVSCEDFLIEHCTFEHGHGMSIGGQTPGGLKRLEVRDCTFDSTVAGIRMKAARGAGGLVEDLNYHDLTMKNVKTAIQITSFYPTIPKQPEDDSKQAVNAKTPIWRNIRITNLTATGSERALQIIGLPEEKVDGVIMSDVKIEAKTGGQIVHAANVKFESSTITVRSGAALEEHDAEVSGI